MEWINVYDEQRSMLQKNNEMLSVCGVLTRQTGHDESSNVEAGFQLPTY